MNFFQVAVERPELQPETIFTVFGVPITNVFLMTWLIIFLLVGLALYLKSKSSVIPGKLQLAVELLIDGMNTMLRGIVGSNKATKFLLPIIGTVFIFLVFGNLLGLLIPGLNALQFDGKPIFRTPSTDFNMTFSLALGLSILTHFMSIKASGILKHLAKFVPIDKVVKGFKEDFGKGMLAIVDLFIGLMDVISEFAKVLSLSMRLFGNLYAGEVLMGIIYGLVATIIPAAWLGMSLLTAVVQAAVFAMLAAVYYSLMVDIVPEEDL